MAPVPEGALVAHAVPDNGGGALLFGVAALLFLGGMFWLILSPDSPYAQPPLQWVRPYDLIGSSVLFTVLNVLPASGQFVYLLKKRAASA
ncbi:hypothetical protein SAMN04488087_1831 [Rhodothermus profundi]|uniref:Uncharacterized protein n=2 Tax=Rhodothermus profundi TaxID=633813 RepID=A0A1M6URP8_9BACT|nr:hypothetical protein SAMN04488087_1831 [Rhodothermus profundi]